MHKICHQSFRRQSRPLIAICLFLAAAAFTRAEDKPRFGPDATPIQQATQYLRTHPAPDYWALSPFYAAQDSDSACSAASISMLLNALRGVPARADVDLITQDALRQAIGDARFTEETAEKGSGVTFAELKRTVALGLHAYDLDRDYEIEVLKPSDAPDASFAALQRLLAVNERSDRDIALVYFNQGALTGDWDGPHVSPIGAYDSESGRVLVMDVDRRYYVPYWSSALKLLDSMRRPAPARFGELAGETGGIVWVRPRRN